MDHLKEVLGFLARWCVLGAACASLLGVVWLALASGNTAAEDSPRIIVSDAMVRQGASAYMTGYYEPAAAESSDIMAGLPGEQFHLGTCAWPNAYLLVSRVKTGSQSVSVRGLPYSPLEFCRADPRMLVLPEGMTGVLIDYRLGIAATDSQRQVLKNIIARFSQKHGVAFIHSGPATTAAQDKLTLMRLGFDQPLIWQSPIEKNWLSVVRAVQGALQARPQDLAVVTADISLAQTLDRHDYAAHLISATPIGDKSKNFRWWPSLEQYAEAMK